MPKIKPLVLISTVLILTFALAQTGFAAHKVRRVAAVMPDISTMYNEIIGNIGSQQTMETAVTDPVENCKFDIPQKPFYDAVFIGLAGERVVAQGEVFETVVSIRNNGNVPWFSANSVCDYPKVYLGTDRARDRSSIFHFQSEFYKTGWLQPNRIIMESIRVNPGEIAVFRFLSQAPMKDSYMREFFTPVVEGKGWLENSTFSTDIRVGSVLSEVNNELLKYINFSTDLSSSDLSTQKSITVDLSEQKMWIYLGNTVIREFRVSSGARRTPTPTGNYQILEKREVRVAAKKPHYIMPKWMMFRKGGFGIHALPSLANDRGVFWREALNHIGSPRSHGCIRLLPKDAEFAYNFAEVGTTVRVQR